MKKKPGKQAKGVASGGGAALQSSSASTKKGGETSTLKQFFMIIVLSVLLITSIYVTQAVASSASADSNSSSSTGSTLQQNVQEIQEYRKAVDEAMSLLADIQHLKGPAQLATNPAPGNLRAESIGNSDGTPHSVSPTPDAHPATPAVPKIEALPATIDSKPNSMAAAVIQTAAQTAAAATTAVVATNQKKDVVIGMAQDTDPRNLAVFCGSLRRVAPNVELILFMNAPIPALHKEIIKKNNVIVLPFKLNELQTTVATASDVVVDAPLPKYHPSTSRWALIYNYFKTDNRWRSYGRVWMIDVRDSTFQLDPFGFTPPAPSPFFYAFTGVESRNIGQCGWNGGWIRDCFGNQMLQGVGRNNIICSGVSVASMDVAMLYLRLMNDIVLGRPSVSSDLLRYYVEYFAVYAPDAEQQNAEDKAKKFITTALPGGESQARGLLQHQFPRCERNGVDQGVHNVLVHNSLLPYLKIFKQGDGPVANMQAHVAVVRTVGDLTQAIPVQEVFNPTGAKVAVAHQYDRYKDFTAHLFSRYCDWQDIGEAAEGGGGGSSAAAAAKACTAFELKSNLDLFKGECDLGTHTASNLAECCVACSATGDCSSFTYLSTRSACYMKTCRSGSDRSGDSMPGAVSGWKV